MPREETAKTYAWFDPVLIPTKRFIFTRVCRGDYERYLALRARAAILASRLRLYDRETLDFVRTGVHSGDTVIDVSVGLPSLCEQAAMVREIKARRIGVAR